MECIRCKKRFDTTIAELNAEQFGHNVCACPHCGKAYILYREIRICVDQYNGNAKTDDWGERIVDDKDYFPKVEKKKKRK